MSKMDASTETLLQVHKLLMTLSREDLAIVSQSVYNRLQIMNQTAFKIGDKVTFDAKTRGIKTGILVKKKAKTFQVLVGSVNWKVTPTLLKKVA